MNKDSNKRMPRRGKTGAITKDMVRLASTLQKVLNTGVATQSKLREIERFTNQAMLSELALILQLLDHHESRHRGLQAEDELEASYAATMKIFSMLKSAMNEGYPRMADRAGRVQKKRLSRLLVIDTESMNLIVGARQSLERNLDPEEIGDWVRDFSRIAGQIESQLRDREALLTLPFRS